MDQEALLPFDNTTPTPPNNINQNLTNVQKNNQNTLTFNGYNNCGLILYELACLSICATIAVIFFIFKIYGGTLLFASCFYFLRFYGVLCMEYLLKKLNSLKTN